MGENYEGEFGAGTHIVKIYYMNLDTLGPTAVGKCYQINNHIHIVVSNWLGINILAHEFGHAFYYSNPYLNGNDPISRAPHNTDPNNLMYPSSELKKEKNIEQAQREAVQNSYLVNATVAAQLQYYMFPNRSIDIDIGENGKLKCEASRIM
ncbi:hypothetical protein BKP37_07005 [Anaerobacillus alkalilacustris]|uniref:Uncharacterized protein n=1 Tax=Anaerobacillus alkalilacustris TaxID=393763 RepID=A0A1S2LTC7_9BACI|nr:hypothetical protein [Anaerobacillus alkalilacustris]OIJ14927.1 hypothetical protein BKP37_07005 [Anaerobacillus alkalilacustris]